MFLSGTFLNIKIPYTNILKVLKKIYTFFYNYQIHKIYFLKNQSFNLSCK